MYIVLFVDFDTSDGDGYSVRINGLSYEPKSIRKSMDIEPAGPFATKAEAQKYARRYAGCSTRILVQEISDPANDESAEDERHLRVVK